MALGDARAISPGSSPAPPTRPASPAPVPRCGAGPDASPLGWPRRTAGLALDVTGCAQLFGGEAGLVARVEAEAAGFGFSLRLGLADTPGAAWAVARYAGRERARPPCRRRDRAGGARHPLARPEAALGARRAAAPAPRTGGAVPGIVPPGETLAALGPLPVAALRLAPEDGGAAAGARPRRIADVAALPRAELARRVGPEVGRRLDQALGRTPEPVSPARPRAGLRAAPDLPRADRPGGGHPRRHRPAAAAALRPAAAAGTGRPPGAADARPHRRHAPRCARSASPGPPTGRRRSARCSRSGSARSTRASASR